MSHTASTAPEGEKILIVDDDARLRRLLERFLDEEGFRVRSVENVEQMDRLLARELFSLVVLDLMMPGEDGLSACRRLREGNNQVPIIMLTAKGDDVDRIIGLEMGADDYVPKPCTPRELVARIRAVLRRVNSTPTESADNLLQIGELTLWPGKRTAQWRNAPLELTSTEFNLLLQLARNAGRVVSKRELSEQALGRSLTRFDRSIDVHLSSIRHKLGRRPDGQSWIETIRGIGYQFIRE